MQAEDLVSDRRDLSTSRLSSVRRRRGGRIWKHRRWRWTSGYEGLAVSVTKRKRHTTFWDPFQKF